MQGDLRNFGFRNCNFWQFDGYDFDAFYARSRESREPEVFAAYFTSASLKEPGWNSHAPDGIQNLEIMTIVPGQFAFWGVDPEQINPWKYKRSARYRSLKDAVETNLLERLAKHFPGAEQHVVFRESATPVTHTRYTRASGGSGYGLAATPDQFMKGRPGYRGEIPGLYFAGANTRAGHGIVGAMLSGTQAARRVLQDGPVKSL